MLLLGIESTCDETAVALVKDGQIVLAESISSQSDLHAVYNGVVPELACRRHIDVLVPLLHETLQRAQCSLSDVDALACATGPGLVGALLVGWCAAKTLAIALRKPMIPVNHVEAHLYAAMMTSQTQTLDCTNSLGLVLSGGHTLFLHIEHFGKYSLIGQTLDDALGECFDKVAVMLGLTYPGGAKLEALAKSGDPDTFPLPLPKIKGRPYDFSFSGLKTAFMHLIAKLGGPNALTSCDRGDLAASFQKTAVNAIATVVERYLKASKDKPQRLFLGGGVTSNQALRRRLQTLCVDLEVHFAPRELCVDNAVMIAGLGYHCRHRSIDAAKNLAVRARWPLTEV